MTITRTAPDLQTLPVGIYLLRSAFQNVQNESLQQAALAISVVPLIVLFLSLQRFLCEGSGKLGDKGVGTSSHNARARPPRQTNPFTVQVRFFIHKLGGVTTLSPEVQLRTTIVFAAVITALGANCGFGGGVSYSESNTSQVLASA